MDVLPNLGDDHADSALGRRPQDGLIKSPFKYGERGRRRLDLHVRDGALLFRRPGNRGVIVGLRLGDVGTRARHVAFRLVELLLRGSLATRQGVGAAELLPGVFQPRFRLGDLGLKRSDLLRAHAGITLLRSAVAAASAARACPTDAVSSIADSSATTSPAPTRSPLLALIVVSWPSTSGAMRTSVARTTPTI